MSALKFKKLVELPATFEPNTVYLVASATPGKFETFVSDNTGTTVKSQGVYVEPPEEPIEPFLLMGV